MPRRPATAALAAAVAALLLTAGCDPPLRGISRPTDDAGPTFVEGSPAEPVYLEQLPWCLDDHGRSPVYPCKWDAGVRPVTGWDRNMPRVVIWVRRDIGCPLVLADVVVSCLWRPEDQVTMVPVTPSPTRRR